MALPTGFSVGSGPRSEDTQWAGDPWCRLAAAVVARAGKDITNCNGHREALARAWPMSRDCEPYLEMLGISSGSMGQWIGNLEPVTQAAFNL
jgi:hypothetical protein